MDQQLAVCDDCGDGYLAIESETFELHRLQLTKDHPNQFAVVHGSKIVGTWETEIEADRNGAALLGDADFLIGRCVPVEEDYYEVGMILA